MNKKVLGVGIVVVAIIIAGGVIMSQKSQKNSEKVSNDYVDQSKTNADSTITKQEEVVPKENAKNGTVALTPENTKIAWVGRKVIVANYEDAGSINIKSGSAEIKDGLVVKANATIDMTSITALTTGKGDGMDMLSKHLKSADFFDAEKYPTAELTLTSAKVLSETTLGKQYEFSGTLTIKGITQPVTFKGDVTILGNMATLEAQTQLDRTKWGVNYGSSKLGNTIIDDMFTVKLAISGEVK
jgi:polyisoprenoid-binding protein YceI